MKPASSGIRGRRRAHRRVTGHGVAVLCFHMEQEEWLLPLLGVLDDEVAV